MFPRPVKTRCVGIAGWNSALETDLYLGSFSELYQLYRGSFSGDLSHFRKTREFCGTGNVFRELPKNENQFGAVLWFPKVAPSHKTSHRTAPKSFSGLEMGPYKVLPNIEQSFPSRACQLNTSKASVVRVEKKDEAVFAQTRQVRCSSRVRAGHT